MDFSQYIEDVQKLQGIIFKLLIKLAMLLSAIFRSISNTKALSTYSSMFPSADHMLTTPYIILYLSDPIDIYNTY